MTTLTMDTPVETKVPTIEELMAATKPITLSDLMRYGSSKTRQEIGGWGQGDTACALSAAGVALEELRAK